MAENTQRVFLIAPKLGGFANDLLVQTEDKKVLYHVKTELFSPLGRSYTVYDESMMQIFSTKQDNTMIFPCHTVFQKDQPVAKAGQLGFLPQNYFLEMHNGPKMAIRIPVFGGIFRLEGTQGVVAEIAQHMSTWIVVIDTSVNYNLILVLLAIVYREYTIGG